MSNKTRLDILLTERGLAESRQKAQAVIMAGHVFVAGQRVDKPGTAVLSDAPIEVRGHTLPYVSRGGLKLEKAMKTFPITLTDKICADIGASTGGFTDCMLQNGARKVYSVDVGYGQLDWKLRSDHRPPGPGDRPHGFDRHEAPAGAGGLRGDRLRGPAGGGRHGPAGHGPPAAGAEKYRRPLYPTGQCSGAASSLRTGR